MSIKNDNRIEGMLRT